MSDYRVPFPLALLASLLPAPTLAAAPDLPEKEWRAHATATAASQYPKDIAALIQGTDTSWYPQVSDATDPWFSFRAGSEAGTWMLTHSGMQTRTDVVVELAEAPDAGDNTSPQSGWQVLTTQRPAHFLDQITFTVHPGAWYRITLHLDATATRPTPLYMNNVGLYDLGRPGLKDYWLMLGASIEVQSISAKGFKQLAHDYYGFDPVMFNLAVGGWMTTQLKPQLAGFLAMHPYARYVAIHIGGNNVSYYRPYPGGGDILASDLVEILEAIVAAGKIPVLARLTYRNYTGNNPVPPEDNGSLPYNVHIVDPLIAQYSPAFFDATAGRGIIDGYSWFRDHPDQLLDGIHVTAAGGDAWQKLWVEQAGAIVYHQAPLCGQACLANTPATGTTGGSGGGTTGSAGGQTSIDGTVTVGIPSGTDSGTSAPTTSAATPATPATSGHHHGCAQTEPELLAWVAFALIGVSRWARR